MNVSPETAVSSTLPASERQPYQAPVLVDLDITETEAFNGGAGDANTGS